MLHPLPRLPRPRPSARRTMAAPRHYSQPSRIRLNNVLPRPAFTTRGAWLSSAKTPLLSRFTSEKKRHCPSANQLAVRPRAWGSSEYHVHMYRVSPPLPCLVFIDIGARCGFWVLCVNSSSLLCGEGEVFRLDSNRGHIFSVCEKITVTQQKAKGSAALRFGAPPPPPDHTLSSHVVYSYTAGGTAAPGEQRLPKPP